MLARRELTVRSARAPPKAARPAAPAEPGMPRSVIGRSGV